MTIPSSPVGTLPPVSFSGLVSGLNTTQIISAYLQVDEAPMVQLQNQQAAVNTKVSAYQLLQGQMQALETAASKLSAPDAFASAVAASSTDTSVATATTGAGATNGSATFSVSQLATANTLISSGTVASTSDVVASGNLLVAAGGAGLGITSMTGSGLQTGSHTIAVTQSSTAASVTGTTSLSGSSTTIVAGSDVVSGTLGGTGFSYTLAAGTYTASQLAAEIGSASGGTLVGSLDANGHLVVSSAQQGSAATLSIGSGSANATLGLTSGQSGTGTDAIVTVDGTANTVSSIAGDGSSVVTLNSGSGGTVTAHLSGSGLLAGTLSAQNVSVGNGSLAAVVGAINGAGAGVSAQALQVGANSYALELQSATTGAANDVTIDPAAFSGSGLGTLSTTTAGQDAIVSLGGSGGYQVHSSTNSFSNLLSGTTISVSSVSSSPVTISVAPDGTAAASLVQGFVGAANTVLSAISGDLAYDPTSKTAGPLNGDYSLQQLQQQIVSSVGQAIGTSSAADANAPGSAAGLSLGQNTINFDATTFAADFAKNPAGVAKMFTQAGSFTPGSGSPATAGDVSLVYAGNGTQAGSYQVQLTQSASQASDNGTASFAAGQTVASADSYTVTSSGVTASYNVQAGQTLAQVAGGLDAAFASAGLQLSAQVVGNASASQLQITSSSYGAAASFSVASTGSDPLGISGAAFSGQDVAGSINGVAASGSGQVLSAPLSDPTLAGLSLQVQTSGVSSPVTLGSYSYSPGIAQSLATLASTALAPKSGEITANIASLQATSSALGSQITLEQQIVVQQQQALTKQYTNLEQTLSTLKSESSFLTQTFGTAAGTSLLSGSSGASSSSTSGSTTTPGG